MGFLFLICVNAQIPIWFPVFLDPEISSEEYATIPTYVADAVVADAPPLSPPFQVQISA